MNNITKKIFITGASGFIGSNLTSKLAKNGNIIHALVRKNSLIATLKHKNIKLFYGDILNLKSLDKSMKGCSEVYHLAAYAKNWARDKNLFHKVNVEGTENVLIAAKKHSIQKVVYTSTSLVLGPSNKVETTELQLINKNPFTDYDQSKIIAEKVIHNFKLLGMNIVTVYPTRVFGPGPLNESNAVTLMLQKYLAGKWRLTLSDGNAIGNYVYVNDLVDGLIATMRYGKKGSKYILGGINISYNDFFKTVSDSVGKRRIMFKIPAKIALLYSRFEKELANRFNHYPLITPGWVKIFLEDWAFSSSKAVLELYFKITPLKSALNETIDWILQNRG